MLEGKPQCSVAAHGNSADCAPGTPADQMKTPLHLRHKLADKEIFVQNVAVARVDVEGVLALRRNDHKLAQTLLFPRLFYSAGRPGGCQKTLVAAQPVQKIQHGKPPARMRVITGRQHGAKAAPSA